MNKKITNNILILLLVLCILISIRLEGYILSHDVLPKRFLLAFSDSMQLLFWFIINFVVLFFYLKNIAIVKIRKIQIARSHKVSSNLEHIIRMKKEMHKIKNKIIEQNTSIEQQEEQNTITITNKLMSLHTQKENDLHVFKKETVQHHCETKSFLQKKYKEQQITQAQQLSTAILDYLAIKQNTRNSTKN